MPPAAVLIGIASIAAMTTITTRTLAVDKTWADNGNVQWPNVSNWIPNGVPTTTDTAIFNMGVVTPPYNVVFLTGAFQPINAVIDRLRVDSSPINFTPTASTLTIDSINITETGRALVIGRTPPGGVGTPTAVLDSLLGQLNTVYATFGVDAGSSGTLNVNAGTFNVTGTSAQFPLILGLNGAGQLNVSGGHTVDIATHAVLGKNAGSSGIANVSGSGTTWTNGGSLYVGHAGQGTFNIASAGQVQTDFPATLGDQAGANGDVNVVGTSSTWNIGSLPGGTGYELTIGRFGSGFLDIWSGADVTLAGDSVLAHQPQSTGNATIDGTGSQWIQQGEIHIGYDGAASIGISSGALLQTTYGYVGGYPGSDVTAGSGQGSVNITGANSHWNTTTGWISLGSGTIGQGGYGSLTVTSGGRVTTTDMGIGNSFDSTGHASVSGLNSLIQVTGGDLYVGLQGAGTLNISTGGRMNVTAGVSTIGWHAMASGDVHVDGAQAKWDTVGPLIVGESGQADLAITGGGRVNTTATSYVGKNAGSIGEVTIDGAPSMWYLGSGYLIVGGAGTGTINILNDGHLGGDVGHIGWEPGGVGVVNVDGPGSSWIVGGTGSGHPISVGFHGQGTLNITAGAHVTSTGHVGLHDDAVGVVNVSGPGSIWSGIACMVGFFGDGTLNITDGGEVANTHGFVGNALGSIGHATVSGTDSLWVCSGNLEIGNEGDGTLTIADGGRVLSAAGWIGDTATSTGQVLVTGPESSWTNNTNLSIGALASGSLTVSNGGVVQSATINIGPLGQVLGDGTLTGDVTNGGEVSPGTSPGALHINGDYAQNAAGDLTIELAAVASHDELLVTGNATLDGALTVSLLNGFTPSPGQTFTILTAVDVDGTFAQVNLPKGLQVIYTPTSVIVEVPGPLCPADVNNSGFVDVDDLIAVILAWGACPMPPTPCPADTNNSGAVDVDDLIAVILAWGACR